MKWPVWMFVIAMIAGTATLASASEHNIAPISISTDSSSYSDGDTVTISGTIRDLDPNFTCGVTIQIWDPVNNLVRIAQTVPSSNGNYEMSFVTGGPQWKESGDYTVSVKCNADDTTTTISYMATPPVMCDAGYENVNGVCVEIPVMCDAGYENVNGVCVEIPPPVVCGPGTELIDGICQVVRPPPPPPPEVVMCDAGYENVNGVCVEIPPPSITCEPGTEMRDGECVEIDSSNGGGCLIATAAYGTEMATQVQYLREIRDGILMSTSVGTSFMSTFNDAYYSISPQIADMERQNPAFREFVRLAVTPLLASLSLMSLAENGSEASVLGIGSLVIALNAGMYIGMPALLAFKAYGRVRTMRVGSD